VVLFLHDAWIHADSWGPWIELFDGSGYDGIALRWPGELPTVADTRADRPRPVVVEPAELVGRVVAAVGSMDRAPILVGHVGGLLAYGLLGRCTLAAVLAVAPLPARRWGTPAFGGDAAWDARRAIPIGARHGLRDAAELDVGGPPLLLVSGGSDRVAPTRSVERVRRRRRHPQAVSDHHRFAERGHSLVRDTEWRDVANVCLDWLTGQDQ
jgi:non-heme chloroperoxidase